MSEILSNISIILIDFYRATVSSIFGGQCRFSPSCSCYARDAFRGFGFRRGFLMTLGRIFRCHPWGGHGFDPVMYSDISKSKDLKEI